MPEPLYHVYEPKGVPTVGGHRRGAPSPVIAVDWYRAFIEALLEAGAYRWFTKLIVLGAFTGLAAFGGAFMNWNFVMAGAASTNALLFVIAIWLMLAWKTAGWIGLDRRLLSALGTPSRPGFVLRPLRQTSATNSGRPPCQRVGTPGA